MATLLVLLLPLWEQNTRSAVFNTPGRIGQASVTFWPIGTATEDQSMKHLLNGVAIAAALVMATSAWAQRSGPGPNAPLYPNYPNAGTSGGGPAAPPSAPAMAPGTTGATTSATPPMHRHARHAAAHHKATTMKHGPTSVSDTTSQLNRAELARLQGGGAMMPPPAPPPSGRMPAPK